MPLASPDFFGLVDDSNPRGTDSRTISDDQHRNIMTSLKQQCPNWTGAVTATHSDVNTLEGFAAAGVKPMPGQGGVTAVAFYNATVPSGWTLLEPDANVRQLTIGGTGATIGGSDDPNNFTVTVTISGSTDNAGSHAHFYQFTSDPEGQGQILVDFGSGTTCADGGHTHDSGAQQTLNAGNHNHDFDNIQANDTVTPRYAMMVLGTLNV